MCKYFCGLWLMFLCFCFFVLMDSSPHERQMSTSRIMSPYKTDLPVLHAWRLSTTSCSYVEQRKSYLVVLYYQHKESEDEEKEEGQEGLRGG